MVMHCHEKVKNFFLVSAIFLEQRTTWAMNWFLGLMGDVPLTDDKNCGKVGQNMKGNEGEKYGIPLFQRAGER